MALDLDKIRATAQRVAVSHGLDVVEIEYVSAAKQRALRVFVEKNASERARLAEAARAAGEEEAAEKGLIPAAVAQGNLTMDQLAWVTHEDCEQFSVDFGTVVDVEDLVPGAEYTLEVSSPGAQVVSSRGLREVQGQPGEGPNLRAGARQPALVRTTDRGWREDDRS